MYVDILFPLVKAILIMFERVTTHYQTLQTWIDHDGTRYRKLYHTCYHTLSPSLTWLGYDVMCYHNFKMLPHMLPYIFSKFSMVLGLLAKRYPALLSNL